MAKMALLLRLKKPLLILLSFLVLATGAATASEPVEKYETFGRFCDLFPNSKFCRRPPPITGGGDPPYKDVILVHGYRDCSYKDLGNGTGVFRVTFDLTAAPTSAFWSRAILLNLYDQSGNPQHPAHIANQITMNGTPSSDIQVIAGFNLYSGRASGGSWTNASAHAAKVEIQLQNQHLQTWPAIGVRTAIWQQGSLTALLRDSKTVSISTTDDSGYCNTGPPTKPPPQDVRITMSAPDWNLGELAQGDSTPKTLAGTREQLCFTYDNPKSTAVRYVINATNQNGLSGDGSYQLRHLASPADTVPYRLELRNMSTNAEVRLPNTLNTVATLSSNGNECFMPTFKPVVGKTAKDGVYGDVLNFTVIAQP